MYLIFSGTHHNWVLMHSRIKSMIWKGSILRALWTLELENNYIQNPQYSRDKGGQSKECWHQFWQMIANLTIRRSKKRWQVWNMSRASSLISLATSCISWIIHVVLTPILMITLQIITLHMMLGTMSSWSSLTIWQDSQVYQLFHRPLMQLDKVFLHLTLADIQRLRVVTFTDWVQGIIISVLAMDKIDQDR